MNKPMRRKGKIIIDLDKKNGSKVLNLFRKEGGEKNAFKKAKDYLYNLGKKLGEKYNLEPAGFWFDQDNDKFTLDMKKVSLDKVDMDFPTPEEGESPKIPTPEAVDDKKKTKKPTPKEKVDKEKTNLKDDLKKKLTPQEALDAIQDIISKVKKVSEPKATRLGMACKRASTTVRKLAAIFNVLDELDPDQAYKILRGCRVKAMIKHYNGSDMKVKEEASKKFVENIESTNAEETEKNTEVKEEGGSEQEVEGSTKKKAEYNPVIDTDIKAKPPYGGEVVKAQEGKDNKQEPLVKAEENAKKPALSKTPEMALTEKTPDGTKKGTKEIVSDLIEEMEAKALVQPEDIFVERKTLASMTIRQLNMLKKQINEYEDNDGNACMVRNGQFLNVDSILNT